MKHLLTYLDCLNGHRLMHRQSPSSGPCIIHSLLGPQHPPPSYTPPIQRHLHLRTTFDASVLPEPTSERRRRREKHLYRLQRSTGSVCGASIKQLITPRGLTGLAGRADLIVFVLRVARSDQTKTSTKHTHVHYRDLHASGNWYHNRRFLTLMYTD